jgi:hypothetical protein
MSREISIIKDTIERLNINLNGLNVLTECGSGHFLYLPIIAAFSNANIINVYIKDTSYGTADSIEKQLNYLIKKYSITANINVYKNDLPENAFKEIDIITNSGMLRPLDKEKLSKANKKIVIPLMYEKWEFRTSDIDINYCFENNIKVAGTWENFPGLNIFDFCEPLILKMIFNAGYEIRENKCIIFSNDKFGLLAKSGIEKLGGKVLYIGTEVDKIYNNIENADYIIFADYMNTSNLITEFDSLFCIKTIKNKNNSIGIIHLAGKINLNYVQSHGLRISPNKEGNAIKMTETLSYLGDLPTLRLLTAGLKVGECLAKNINNNLVQML